MSTYCIDCGEITERSPCASCRGQRDSRRGSPSKRGYDTRFRQARESARRVRPYCIDCGTAGDRANPLTGDHLLPLSRGGNNDPSNIVIRCRRCNSSKGASA